MEEENLKQNIEILLKEKIEAFSLKGEGMCNKVFLVETETGNRYLAKVEKLIKETEEQNDLIIEGKLIEKLNMSNPSLLVPFLVLIQDSPKMYVYKYVEGEMMINGWSSLNEQEKVNLCSDIGYFHSQLHKAVTLSEVKDIGLKISTESSLEEAIVNQYNLFLNDKIVPESWKKFALGAKDIFDKSGDGIFKFIHNDAHNENIIINNGRLAGFVDFGDAEFTDIHKEFCYYVRQYPDYFQYIIKEYQKFSGNKVSIPRIVSYAFLRDLDHLAYYFANPDSEKQRLEKLPDIPVTTRVENYKRLMDL